MLLHSPVMLAEQEDAKLTPAPTVEQVPEVHPATGEYSSSSEEV